MKSGIHLERSKNTQFIRIQSKILSLGHQFISPSQNTFIQLSSQELIGLPQHHINQLIQENNEWINVQEYSNLILKYCRLEETRRKVWLELYKGSDEKADILNQLLKSRGELASVLGYANYASYWLQDKMAKSPGELPTIIQPQKLIL